jgi:hypothetical protein
LPLGKLEQCQGFIAFRDWVLGKWSFKKWGSEKWSHSENGPVLAVPKIGRSENGIRRMVIWRMVVLRIDSEPVYAIISKQKR